MFQYKVNRFLLYQSNFNYFTASVYSSSVTSPSHSALFSLTFGVIPICVKRLSGAAPCQWTVLAGIFTTSPGCRRWAGLPLFLVIADSFSTKQDLSYCVGMPVVAGAGGESYIINVTIIFRLCGKHLQPGIAAEVSSNRIAQSQYRFFLPEFYLPLFLLFDYFRYCSYCCNTFTAKSAMQIRIITELLFIRFLI